MTVDYDALFRQNDDREFWEAPRGFVYLEAAAKFSKFVEALSGQLGRRFAAETGSSIQDASFHSQIDLGAGALRFSSFGEMIAFTPDHEAPPDVVDAVAALARTHGYVLIPTEALERDYPGYRDEGPRIRTWWIRFFDWL